MTRNAPRARTAHHAGCAGSRFPLWDGAEGASFLLADIGYRWGVVPVDIAIVVGLLLFGRIRKGLFFAVAVAGSALLKVAAKLLFARMRPDLWERIVDEHSFSFPGGHAMGSMTLALGVVVLLWDTRWRWPALLGGLFAVAASRVWLGVHYPSDILAAWTAAAAWVFGVAHFFRMRRRKPSGEPVPTEPKHPASATTPRRNRRSRRWRRQTVRNMRSRSPSARRAAMSCSRRASARRPSRAHQGA